MKIVAVCLLILLLMTSSPFEIMQFDSWQLPLWFTDLSWIGIELVGALLAVLAVIVCIALVGVGLLGAGIAVSLGLLIALLFGSLMIAWPLLLIAFLCWLVSDNKKVA
ncbi:hypothetical protein AMS58_00210 [Pseudoalteromonas porphyrae]|uniref:Uncharacterized protein n=1 Tax=Pseudoalteromonas porphyrae TaxID=187330 RepID=A0A0N0LUB3_9GAMM|nr:MULTISPECIES: hypothetical protein [Pseudoalteromonas]KPH56908.1 hypothetical protein ADS77_19260 [Pseudoalteromonas porphyrae]KPH96527.1 hypothetical protein AMS58_00210 [Pseudoalteromonas porphyrae]NMR26224.1 hypothetical protein [Pseudoalteromonas sp. NEC-BIFX-2020_015]NNG44490.1 hypothetical protein [Pseudoalteromonas sp. NEC-BIFX-2020_002]